MIGKLVKFLIDTVIHGKILYDLYGLGWPLVAAFWDSLTTFFTHRAMNHRENPTTDMSTPSAPVDPPRSGYDLPSSTYNLPIIKKKPKYDP